VVWGGKAARRVSWGFGGESMLVAEGGSVGLVFVVHCMVGHSVWGIFCAQRTRPFSAVINVMARPIFSITSDLSNLSTYSFTFFLLNLFNNSYRTEQRWLHNLETLLSLMSCKQCQNMTGLLSNLQSVRNEHDYYTSK